MHWSNPMWKSNTILTEVSTVANGVPPPRENDSEILFLYHMAIYPKLILDALATVRYPGNGKDLVAAGMVEDDIRIEGNKVSFSLIFERPNDPFQKSVVKAAETAILTYVGEDVENQRQYTGEKQAGAGSGTRETSPASEEHYCRIVG